MLSSSIGLSLGQDGEISDVVLGTPAYKAGIGPGMKLVAVNARRFSPEGAGRSARRQQETGSDDHAAARERRLLSGPTRSTITAAPGTPISSA